MHQHIGPAISVDIAELACDGNEIVAATEERGAGVDKRVRRVPARKLDNDNAAIHIHKDKMRRLARAILMSHAVVYLEGTRHAIGRIILAELPPGTKGIIANNQ